MASRRKPLPERRGDLAQLLLDDVARLRERAWQPYTMAVSTQQGVEKVTLDLPPLGDVRHVYSAISVAVDKHLALVKHDSDTGLEGAKSMLGQLAEGLKLIADSIPAEDAA